MAVINFKQNNFKLGLNRLDDPSSLLNGEYPLLLNGRVRNGGIDPVKLPTEVVLPRGLLGHMQGLYAADRYLLFFCFGKAYYRNMESNALSFLQIKDFNMSNGDTRIYACVVPQSSMDYDRKLVGNVNGPVALTLGAGIGTPAAIVCQDGVNQPNLIFSDGTSRQAYTYEEWDNTARREYVPIGKQMLYSNGILYVITKDESERYTQICRSVTGRPLDFMVNITSDGSKGGDAQGVSYRCDFSEITSIANLNALSGGFYVSTAQASYLVTPDFTNPIFAEPQFSNQFLFSTGALNQESVVDVLGDAALIDYSGIKSFNSIAQVRVEGRNSPFSAKIQSILGDSIQKVTASTEFDNYAFFAVQTVYGNAVMVFDTLLNVWVSIDKYPNVEGNIIQFAAVKTTANRRLFFITDKDKMYEMFTGKTAKCGYYTPEWNAGSEGKEQKPVRLNLIFSGVEGKGTVSAQCFLDSVKTKELTRSVDFAEKTKVSSDSSFLEFPFGSSTKESIENQTFDFQETSYGWKTGFWITWDFKAKLLRLDYEADIRNTINSSKSTAKDYAQFNQDVSNGVFR